MRRIMKLAFVAIAGFACMPVAVRAQQMPPVPVDKEVRIGKLDIVCKSVIMNIRRTRWISILPRRWVVSLKRTTSADWRISLNTCVSTEQGTSRAAL